MRCTTSSVFRRVNDSLRLAVTSNRLQCSVRSMAGCPSSASTRTRRQRCRCSRNFPRCSTLRCTRYFPLLTALPIFVRSILAINCVVTSTLRTTCTIRCCVRGLAPASNQWRCCLVRFRRCKRLKRWRRRLCLAVCSNRSRTMNRSLFRRTKSLCLKTATARSRYICATGPRAKSKYCATRSCIDLQPTQHCTRATSS
ncbi:unannotated protein [freshwater metagenome]|uniref:Unannotated protein n=1 Tax=freshwater metagenome TaxID=449393 RepID=A0A6J6KG73_9ZZZZ